MYSRYRTAFAAHEVAQNVVEYGLLLATIGIAVVLGANAFGGLLGPWFPRLAASIVTTGT
jgi:Flp pilus assembly pilin Flp